MENIDLADNVINKKNILIISVYYPPIQSIASNRLYSFAKYLDKTKYNIHVLTVDEPGEYVNDLDGVTIHRVNNSSFFKPFLFEKRTNKFVHYAKVIHNKFVNFIIDEQYAGWIKGSVNYIEALSNDIKFDVIISSFAPIATHKTALVLKEKYPNIKWIADMRDEMSLNPYISKKTKSKLETYERKILNSCDALTSVSKPILDEFKNMTPRTDIIFKEIRNGYDFDIINTKTNNNKFTIVYAGNFYGSRNPSNFLDALASLMEQGLIENFVVKFIGVKTYFDIPKILIDSILIIKTLAHRDAIIEMQFSDALLLIHPNNGRKGVFTGKLFEYLATLKPIIALVDPDDVAAALIKKSRCGYIADPESIDEIQLAILSAYRRWKDNLENLDIDIDIITKHHRREQAKRLELLIEELIDE